MKKTLLTRALSAVIAVILIAFFYFLFGSVFLEILVYMAMILGAFEYSQLVFCNLPQAIRKQITFFLMGSVGFFALISKLRYIGYNSEFFRAPFFNSESLVAIFTVISSSLFLMMASRKLSLEEILKTIFGLLWGFLYMGVFPLYVVKILNLAQGDMWFAIFLGTIFSSDIGAYLVGSRWGRRKMLPSLSPHKSWEGSVGGFFFAFIFFISTMKFWDLKVSAFSLVGIVSTVLLSIFSAQMGDFFESLLKRTARVKDSGSIMPGHGGLLDRIDAVLFAAPIFYSGLWWLQTISVH